VTVVIDDLSDHSSLAEPAGVLASSRKAVVISGAGISVESGIPDFRSPGGLWEKFDPMEYAYIETFRNDPEKAWQLFREVGRTLAGKVPNRAHYVLAELEERGLLHALITQNIDGLHQAAGSRNIIEVHGDHSHLECLECRHSIPSEDRHYDPGDVPKCERCGYNLKPAVVLFGEAIRGVDRIEEALDGCDVILTVGTSAQVQPVASLPWQVKTRGGVVIEFDLTDTQLTGSCSDYFVKGNASETLDRFAKAAAELRGA
jgi:NAD-dependent deacetylase